MPSEVVDPTTIDDESGRVALQRRREARVDHVHEIPFNEEVEVTCPECGETITIGIHGESERSYGSCWTWDCDAYHKFHRDRDAETDDAEQSNKTVQTKLVTDGGRDIDFAEEILDPPMYPEWEDVETWSKANLRYPVPGGWEIADHGKFHTTWEHEDGTELTRSSKRTPGTKDTFAFSVDGEEIHSVETGLQRVERREETVWLLQFYDEKGIESVEEFEVEVRKERNQSLDEFVTDGGEARAE